MRSNSNLIGILHLVTDQTGFQLACVSFKRH